MNAGDKIVKVMIGRFQPFHNGHLKCLRAAIDTADHVVVAIGSAQESRTKKNPWSWVERHAMIVGALTPAERMKVSIIPAYDRPGQDKDWVKEIKSSVRFAAREHIRRGNLHFTLVGCHKGSDTYYLGLYRGWSLDVMPISEGLNATDIRNLYFSRESATDSSGLIEDWGEHLPGSSYAFLWLWKWAATKDFMKLIPQRTKKENA